MIELNLNPSRKELRQFTLLQVVFFALIAGMLTRRGSDISTAMLIVGVSAVVGLIGWFVPAFMRIVYIVWMAAVFPIGWTVSHLLLALVYYLVVTPLGFAMRLSGRDPMQRKFDRNATTYWQPRPGPSPTKRYFRPF